MMIILNQKVKIDYSLLIYSWAFRMEQEIENNIKFFKGNNSDRVEIISILFISKNFMSYIF